MMAVGDQFTDNLRFAHREFEQTSHTIYPAAPSTRHAIEGVGDIAHPVFESFAGIVLPGVAVTATDTDVAGTQLIDEWNHAG